jgi:hypothetical protein
MINKILKSSVGSDLILTTNFSRLVYIVGWVIIGCSFIALTATYKALEGLKEVEIREVSSTATGIRLQTRIKDWPGLIKNAVLGLKSHTTSQVFTVGDEINCVLSCSPGCFYGSIRFDPNVIRFTTSINDSVIRCFDSCIDGAIGNLTYNGVTKVITRNSSDPNGYDCLSKIIGLQKPNGVFTPFQPPIRPVFVDLSLIIVDANGKVLNNISNIFNMGIIIDEHLFPVLQFFGDPPTYQGIINNLFDKDINKHTIGDELIVKNVNEFSRISIAFSSFSLVMIMGRLVLKIIIWTDKGDAKIENSMINLS